MKVRFRQTNTTDAEAISKLSKQLGYTTEIEDAISYINTLHSSDKDDLIVAELEGEVIAWMQLSYILRVESGYFAEITGIVVDGDYRSTGIGKMLVDYAKEWCGVKDVYRLRVRTNIARLRTHDFYERNGFTLCKEQKVFEMNL